MTEKIYPRWIRAFRVREDMVLITIKNAPDGAIAYSLSCGEAGLLLGSPDRGWMRLAVPASLKAELSPLAGEEIPEIRVVDVYGTEMRGLCTSVLAALEEQGQRILGVSLTTQRLSAAVQGEYPDLAALCGRFSMGM